MNRRTIRRRRPRSRDGIASVEVLMALAPLFLTAWAFADLGAKACQAFLHLSSHLVLWPLL